MRNRIVACTLALISALVLLPALFACSAAPDEPAPLVKEIKPGTEVPFSVEIEVVNKETVASQPQTASFRFVVSADSRGSKTGVHEQEMRAVMREIKKLEPQPAFMVVIGDMIQGNSDPQKTKEQYGVWKALAGEFYPLDFYYTAVGNHEMIMRGQEGLDAFNEAFSDTFDAVFYGHGYGRSVYYFDRGNARFFVLNNYHPEHRHAVAADVVQWMRDNTDESKSFNFVFSHAPGWPTGAHTGDCLDAYPKQRAVFWQVVDAMPGAVFFAGHEHNYSRTQIDASFSETLDGTEYAFKNTVQQVVVGGLGSTLQTGFTAKKGVIVPPQIVFCYSVVDVFADHVRVQSFDVDGNRLDDFEVKSAAS